MTAFKRMACPLLFLAGALWLAGCNKGEDPGNQDGDEGELIPIAPPGASRLSGTITHGGKKVSAGRMMFFAEKGLVPVVGKIENGAYEVDGLPEGEVTIALILDPNGELPIPAFILSGAGGPDGQPPEPLPGGPIGGPAGGPPDGPPPPPGDDGKQPKRMGPKPPDLPPQYAAELQSFDVPKEEHAALAPLHKKYSKTSGPDMLKCRVSGLQTTFNIDLR